jgi:nitrogen fixation protein NifB
MNISNHPCFNPKACKSFGRVHLPVAPACNIQCNFCNRKFDCVNESRPGVSSSILTPDQAMAYLEEVMAVKEGISVVGIAGPGDPFANPIQTMTTLELVRQAYPEMLLCVASNGLNLAPYLDDLKAVDVSHVSITVNAVDPVIGEKVYSWVRDNKKTLGPELGARLLLERQLEAIKGLKDRGIIVKVNTIVLPGINDHHVEAIARQMATLKVDLFNCMAYFPNEGANLSHLKEPSPMTMKKIQNAAKAHIPQMLHCKRCRADAVGRLDEATDTRLMDRLVEIAAAPRQIPESLWKRKKKAIEPRETEKSDDRPYVAVATQEGVLINQHLGEAQYLNIYDTRNENPVMIERRRLPKPGGKDFRWFAVADTIKDCHQLLVSGIGTTPREILAQRGINILEINGMIELVITALKNEQDISHLMVREHNSLGECRGTGMGCM